MNLFNKIKNVINRIFYNSKRLNAMNGIENAPTTSKISVIDTSSLDINRVLTDEEKQKVETYSQEIDLTSNQIIEYGNEISRKVSYYMEISRKRLNQNIEKNKEFLKEATPRNVISQKLDIEFNNLEIRSILEELQNLKRECELRIIALEEKGQAEIQKGKKLIFFLESKVDLVKVNLINNAIERTKTTIKIIEMLSSSIKNELIAVTQEEKSLNRYIKNSDSEENIKITNELLDKRFEEQKGILQAIQEIGKSEEEFPQSLLKEKLGDREISEKLKIIVEAKRYIDLYVEKNKRDFLKPGGLFEKTQNALDVLREQIETDYYDLELWAKKELNYNSEMSKISKSLENIEKIINIFDEEIPEEFKRKFYKVKFYEKALLCEQNQSDVAQTFLIENETERKYYAEFLKEIIDKIHRESDDAELLQFMDKNLQLKDIDNILNDYEKIIAILRIEKYGREGLFTLRFFKKDTMLQEYVEYENMFGEYSGYYRELTLFNCHIGHSEFAFNIKNTKFISLDDANEFDGINGIKIEYKPQGFLNLTMPLEKVNGASSKFTQEILKLWNDSPRKSTSFKDFITKEYEYPFIVEIPQIAELVLLQNFNLYISSKYIHRCTIYGNYSDLPNFFFVKDRFFADTQQAINRKIREDKQNNKSGWNSNNLLIQYSGTSPQNEYGRISLAEIICRYALAIQEITKLPKEEIRDRILSFDSFKVRKSNRR